MLKMEKLKPIEQIADDVNEGDLVSFRLKIGEDYIGLCYNKSEKSKSYILKHFPSGKSWDFLFYDRKIIVEKDGKGRRVESYKIIRRAKNQKRKESSDK